jgi:hypothetical protein
MSIEAMKLAQQYLKDGMPAHAMMEINEAIKQAEQAQPVAQTHCPEKRKPGGCQLHNLHCGWPKCNEPPKQEQAQTVADKVGRITANVKDMVLRQEIMLYTDDYLPIGTALYTAPPPRQPLTDEEIDLFINGRGDEGDDDYVEPTGDGFGLTDADLVRLVRRVEAAHGITKEST